MQLASTQRAETNGGNCIMGSARRLHDVFVELAYVVLWTHAGNESSNQFQREDIIEIKVVLV